MSNQAILFAGFMAAVVALVGGIALWRLRRFSARRAEAEQRAAAAFEEMHRTTKALRETRSQETVDPNVKPGERLLQRYSGVAKRPRERQDGP